MNPSNFIAFSIIILISGINTDEFNEITKTINAQYTIRRNNDPDGSRSVGGKQQQYAFKTTKTNRSHTERELMAFKLMMTDKIAISTANPSYFNKNSLQAQQQQEQYPWTSRQQRHFKDQYTSDNKHPPCDYVEQHTSPIVTRANIIAEGIKITNTGALSTNFATTTMSTKMTTTTKTTTTTTTKSTSNTTQIDATAKGYKPLGPQHTINGSVDTDATTSFTRNNGRHSPFHSSALNVARNGFRDKINISNQRNEFRSDDELVDDDVFDYDDVDAGVGVGASVRYSNGEDQNSASDNYDDGATAFRLHQQQSAKRRKRKNRTITDDTNTKSTSNNTTTTTSRNSNNTVATATSSFFERVELLESGLSPDKRHELRQQRRKRYLLFPEGSSFQLVFDLIIGIVDYTSYAILGITCSVAWELPSKAPSEIIENFRDKLNDGTFGLQRRNDSTPLEDLQYIETLRKNSTSSTPTPKRPPVHQGTPTMTSDYGHNYPYSSGYSRIAADMAALPGVVPHAAAGDNFVETQRKTLNDKAETTSPHWHWSRPDKFYYNKYSKHGDEWSGNDKPKYAAPTAAAADWHQQRGSNNEFNNKASHDNRQDYIADSDEYTQLKNNAGWQQKNNNWSWQRNKQRWQQKQQQWENYGKEYEKEYVENNWRSYQYSPKRPITSYANGGSYGNYQRTGRQRKILKEPPKHRIYPVFGRKKRVAELPQLALQLELEMERIHFRDQLRSRQKLYGKIEQLFQTRGHNGTACVLRALCETGQRQHHEPHGLYQLHHQHLQRQRHRQPYSTAGQQSGPQSFITELLRAIFALPKDARSWDAGPAFELLQHRELETHMPAHYREAHSYTGDCAARFDNCEHSIWNDGITRSRSRHAPDNGQHGRVGRTFKM